jgi:hypothetical protein
MTIMYKNVFQSLASELGQAKHSFKRRADNTFHTTRVAVHLMMPVYHTSDNALSEEDFYVVADSWKIVQCQQYSEFIGIEESFQQQAFADVFFERLFDVDPVRFVSVRCSIIISDIS